jgi:hypothetical protein
MPSLQFRFDFAPRPMLRLSEIEQILKQYRVMRTPPSRNTLIEMCEEGTLEGNKTRFGWMVYEDSFEDWVRSLQQQRIAA